MKMEHKKILFMAVIKVNKKLDTTVDVLEKSTVGDLTVATNNMTHKHFITAE